MFVMMSQMLEKTPEIQQVLPGAQVKEMLEDQANAFLKKKDLKLIRSYVQKGLDALGDITRKNAQKTFASVVAPVGQLED